MKRLGTFHSLTQKRLYQLVLTETNRKFQGVERNDCLYVKSGEVLSLELITQLLQQ